MHTIIVDTSAGEGKSALEAAALASLEFERIQFVLVGDEGRITSVLEKLPHDAERLRVVHADESKQEPLSPRETVAGSLRSAIAVGIELLAESGAATFVSAGNPGVIVLEAHDKLKLRHGVQRAALAAVYPTMRHRGRTRDPLGLLLDVGATTDCSAEDLVVFAALGAAYASKVSMNECPKVALLSNGTNIDSAPERVRRAHNQLIEMSGAFEYVGPIRADQVTRGEADVVVSDGFSGDIVIRTLEGVVGTAQALLSKAQERFSWRVGVSMLGDGIKKLRELTDWENYGGAPLLGFDRPIIVTQSNSHRRAFFNAIRLAAKIQRTNVHDALDAALANLPE